jgi:hypothetical protein
VEKLSREVKSQLDGIDFVFGWLSTSYLNLVVIGVLEYSRLLSQTVFAFMHDKINRFKIKEGEEK